MTGSGPWLRRFHRKTDVVGRLVCLPHAGGSASYFHPLSRLMSDLPVEVIIVQYPGRQDRSEEPVIEDLAALGAHVATALEGSTDLPFVLFGHSMGATIAFEAARRLETDGARAAALMVSARRAPSIHRTEPAAALGDAELLAEVMSMSGAGSDVLTDPDIMAMVLPVIRGDYTAVANYRYQPGPDVTCPVVAVLGDTDPKVDESGARVWAQHTTGPFELISLPGGHFYLDTHWETIIKLVVDRLPAR